MGEGGGGVGVRVRVGVGRVIARWLSSLKIACKAEHDFDVPPPSCISIQTLDFCRGLGWRGGGQKQNKKNH